MSVLSIATMAVMTAGFVKTELGSSMAQSAAARTGLRAVVGNVAVDSGVVNGKPVPASVLRNAILITDHNTFRFPKVSGARPKQVDSIAAGGP